MNRLKEILLGICLILWWMFFPFASFAAGYVPTTKWPYLYEEFVDGTVFFSGGKKAKQQKLNIHLQQGALHYLDGDKVLQSISSDVEKVRIGNDLFIRMDGEWVRLVKLEKEIALVKAVRADLEALSKNASGAYGMSSDVSAVDRLTSIQLGGISNLSHQQMKVEKNDGEELPLLEKYYFVFGDKKILEATRKGIEKSLTDADKVRLKTFVKENKIKWKEEDSLMRLLDFFQ